MLGDILAALGWKGGTIHQAVREIQRLRRIEAATEALMSHLAFRANCNGYHSTAEDEKKLHAVNDAFHRST